MSWDKINFLLDDVVDVEDFIINKDFNKKVCLVLRSASLLNWPSLAEIFCFSHFTFSF